jgi:hypothetical protein
MSDNDHNKTDIAAWLHDHFRELRFSEGNHLGMGDIRLTLGMQDDIVVNVERAINGKRVTSLRKKILGK